MLKYGSSVRFVVVRSVVAIVMLGVAVMGLFFSRVTHAATHTTYAFEGEDSNAMLTDVVAGSDTSASDEKYVTSSATGSADYGFQVATAGTYYLWARIESPSAGAATLNTSVEVDGNQVVTTQAMTTTAAADHPWQFVPLVVSGQHAALTLPANTDIFVTYDWVTANAKLDMWILTTDAAYTPKFNDFMPQPDITVTNEVDKAEAEHGDTLTYTLTAENTGQASAREAYIGDLIPTNVTIDHASETFKQETDSNGLTYVFGPYTLAPGEKHTVTLVAKIR